MLSLAGRLAGFDTGIQAQVRWADTEGRAFAATVDALVKMHQIGVPMPLILERFPGFTQQDVERAKKLIAEGDPLGQLEAMLERQSEVGEDVVEPSATPDGEREEMVEDLALNGAQISSLLSIVQEVTNGMIGPDTAKALIRASFPSLSTSVVNEMIDGAVQFEPAVSED